MSPLTPEEDSFFAGDEKALGVYRAIRSAIEAIGPAELKVSKSQIGFCRAHPFAAVWRPVQYLSGERAPVVLSVFLRGRDPSPRWKEVVEPSPGRFTHHAELRSGAEVETFEHALAEAWRQSA